VPLIQGEKCSEQIKAVENCIPLAEMQVRSLRPIRDPFWRTEFLRIAARASDSRGGSSAFSVVGERMTKTFAILLLGLVVGCSSVRSGHITSTLYTREVVLSLRHPEDDFLKAKLVAIAEDGTTTIGLISTGDTLRAAPGDYFSSNTFGAHGRSVP
jgi:hypothetical protein